MKTYLATGVAFLTLSAGSAFGQDLSWSGFYAGGSLGNLEIEASVPGVKENDTAYGIHAGYRHDTGTWVIGGEFEHEWTNIQLVPGALGADRVMRLKATGGYDLGKTLLYVAAGAAQVSGDGLGNEWGSFYGLGAAYAVSPKTAVSLEMLEHDFSDIADSGIDADAWSVNLRVSVRF